MKVASKLAVLVSLGALTSFASAKSLEQSYLESCRKDPGVPVPISVVSPRVAPELVGESVEIEFTVTATGTTSGFSVKSPTDPALADAVVEAVKQWQFAPAHKDGVAVATKVVLPVHIVDDDGQLSKGYAAN